MWRFIEDFVERPIDRSARRKSRSCDPVNAERGIQILDDISARAGDDARVAARVDPADHRAWLAANMEEDGFDEALSKTSDTRNIRVTPRVKRLEFALEARDGAGRDTPRVNACPAQTAKVHDQAAILCDRRKALRGQRCRCIERSRSVQRVMVVARHEYAAIAGLNLV
jgi:hypothetical protein